MPQHRTSATKLRIYIAINLHESNTWCAPRRLRHYISAIKSELHAFQNVLRTTSSSPARPRSNHIILLCDSICADRTEDTLYARSPREPPNRTGFISVNIFRAPSSCIVPRINQTIAIAMTSNSWRWIFSERKIQNRTIPVRNELALTFFLALFDCSRRILF